MYVQVARPPTFGCHVHRAAQLDSLLIVGVIVDREVTGAVGILRPALDLEGILTARKAKLDLAGKDEVVLRGLARALQVDECVRFLGYRSDVPEILAGADLVLMTSWASATPRPASNRNAARNITRFRTVANRYCDS